MPSKKIIISVLIAIIFVVTALFFGSIDQNQMQNYGDSNQESDIRIDRTLQSNKKEKVNDSQIQKKVISKSKKQNLPTIFVTKNKLLTEELSQLLHCDQNKSCPQDSSDPRASSILLGKLLSEKLNEYVDLHLQYDYFDQQSIELTKQFLNYPDGHVQKQAINLMSAQQPNLELASLLINELETSFNAKIIRQSLKELQRYPELSSEIQQLFYQVLTTGSFYAGEELATNILPYLNTSNVGFYTELADSLPQNSAKERALRSNIEEFLLRQSGG